MFALPDMWIISLRYIATGFLATQVVLSFVEKGFKVRGTARSQPKIDEWEAKHPEAKGNNRVHELNG